jgi:hypothetical protein
MVARIQQSPAQALPEMVRPSLGSTLAFCLIVAAVIAAVLAGIWVASARGGDARAARRATLASAGAIAAILIASAGLAESGVLRRLAGSPALMVYVGGCNAIAIATAFSRLGRRLALELPVWAIVGFQAFRLPLELVLHEWYAQGAIPIQMTYSGHNFDIVTGALAVLLSPLLAGLDRLSARSARSAEKLDKVAHAVLWFFTLAGTLLLLNVASIAIRSSPVPLRTYLNEPVLLLGYHAPYTWIVPICVAGALLGHLVAFRRLFAWSAAPARMPG